MSRALLRGIQCHACRHNVLRSFVSVTGVAINSPIVCSASGPQVHPPHLSRGFSSQHAKLFTNKSPEDSEPVADVAADTKLENTDAQETSKQPEEPEEHVPWYLQEEVQDTAAHPLRQQQPLPPLPENPPPILQNMLQHISVDLGLDDLNILDLRGLDPPPALGANLIMIFGTARAVKHLNVSADRLCRWLRTTYKLRPDADGLLGRNELKIKLRRKARRAKLAKSAGSTLAQPDDGITTGWICVDVGTVEGGQLRKSEPRPAGFVGFGTVVEGTRIVVQMMTAEKREEVDLEGLWGKVLSRNSMENEGISQPQVERYPQVVCGTHEPSNVALADSSHRVSHTAQIRPSHEQRRGISTSLRRLQDHRSQTTVSEADSVREIPGEETKPTEPTYKHALTMSLLRRLSYLAADQAIHELGEGVQDRTSTNFLNEFYGQLQIAPPDMASALVMDLICVAIMLGHPGYSKVNLFEKFQEHIISNFPVSQSQVQQLIKIFVSFEPDLNASPPRLRLPPQEMEFALQLVDHADLRGLQVLDADVIVQLFIGVSYRARVYPVKTTALSTSEARNNRIPVSFDEYDSVLRIQTRLSKVLTATKAKLSNDHHLELLRVYLYQKQYKQFWEKWQDLANAGVRRGKAFYSLLFEQHLQDPEGWEHSRTTFLSCLSMMEKENPPVFVDAELARSIMEGIMIAHPDTPEKIEQDERLPGPLVSAWHRCQEVIRKEAAGPQDPL
ncbi:hypothetical protein AJ79_07394 [Helicocarpus griseus UAMH5409]|uniref:ATPase synthesis protein 25 n=1 Tax=Helicocarpus griseus UAMH5409 TaxID=1447875 RepID=A0A2B7X2N6_9EURO|nr:hypothetical protein AJ79_07394 [Helicocarpus griseus UAMH5409]